MTRVPAIALGCFLTLAAGKAPACWGMIDPGGFAGRCPVVVSGVIERIDEAELGGQQLRGHDIAHIVIHRVFKNELNEPLRSGGFVRVRMDAAKNRLVSSTDLRYQVGTAGTWLIALKDDGELYVNVHPVQRQPQDSDARALVRDKGDGSGLTRAEWLAVRKEGKRGETKLVRQGDAARNLDVLHARTRELAAALRTSPRLGWDQFRRFDREPEPVRRQLFRLTRAEMGLSASNHIALCGHVLRNDPAWDVRLGVHYWLDATDLKQAGLLLEMCEDRSASVRVMACQAVRDSKQPAYAARVARLLGDPDPQVRETAVTTLGWLGDRKQITAVLALFQRDGNQKNVYAFAWSLARLGETEVSLDCARAAFQSDNWNVRHFAVEALSLNRSKEVVPAIVRLLAGELGRTVGEMKTHNVGDRVFVGLCEELRKRTGQKLGNDLLAWHGWWEEARNEYSGARVPLDRDAAASLMAEYRRLSR